MRGHSVINAMGWDSFGLPAENAALERSISPAVWTNDNIKHMTNQLESLNFNLDWREATSDPSFYKWTQWLFLQLYKHGLVFKSMSLVNWDPVDQTVLANDQVDEEGRSWRSGAKVEKKYLRQWFIKVSSCHEELCKNDNVNIDNPYWKELIGLQKPFLGEPSSYLLYLNIEENTLPVICDYPEYFSSPNSFLAVDSNHWILSTNITSVINPFTGQRIEIKKSHNPQELPPNGLAILLNSSDKQDPSKRDDILNQAKSNPSLGGYKSSKSFYDWVVSRQRYWGTPIPMIICPKCGNVPVSEKDLPVHLPPVNDLKSLKNSSDRDDCSSRLSVVAPDEWLHVKCPNCSGDAKRETDTCDTFFDSSWYYLRYASEPLKDKPFDLEANKRPVWLYFGGAEHSRGHLLYSRFIYRFLKKHNYLQSSSSEPFHNLVFFGYIHAKTYKHKGKYISQSEYEKLCKEETFNAAEFELTFEKMSKSKGNGINPVNLLETFGIDATRITVNAFVNPRKPRYWSTVHTEIRQHLILLRRIVLTIDQFIFIQEVAKESARGPLVRRFTIQKPFNDAKKMQIIQLLNSERKQTAIQVADCLETFIDGASKLRDFLDLIRKYALVPNICDTPEYERCLADLIIMYTPFLPHLSEECWAALGKYVRPETKQFYHFDKLAMDQKWPS